MIVHGRSLHLSITLVELKRPQQRILKSNGEPTSDFGAAQRQTISRLAAINKDRQRFLSELKENLKKLVDEKSHSPYQGAIHDNFFDVLRFDDLDDFICSGKIIIGRRADETLAERKFRTDFFTEHRVEIMPYDPLLDVLEKPPTLIEPEWSWY